MVEVVGDTMHPLAHSGRLYGLNLEPAVASGTLLLPALGVINVHKTVYGVLYGVAILVSLELWVLLASRLGCMYPYHTIGQPWATLFLIDQCFCW